MSPRLAPALGLAAACAMLIGVGLIAISIGDDGTSQVEVLAPVRIPSSTASRVTPSLAARQLSSAPVRKATRPPSSSPAPSLSAPASVTPSIVVTPSTSVSVPPPSSSASSVVTTPSSTASVSAPGSSAIGTGPALHTSTDASTRDTYAQAVFQAVNRARAAHHLAPLQWSAQLQASAHRHNLTMARSNTLSHQVDGEPDLGARETAAGVQWTYAAENIGWTTDRTAGGALDIENRMYTETAPNDAHKRNILSAAATSIGVDVYIDAAHGRLWLTEDFSG